MNNATNHQPLSEGELDRLGEFLAGIGPSAMNTESLDGYFAALVCSPTMVLPSEYLPQIWGEEFAFDSDTQATDILSLLLRHWNTISAELQRTLNEQHVYLPVLLEGHDGQARGNDWAQGFLRGVKTHAASWRKLIESDECGGAMLPIMLLAHEHDPDPALRPNPVAPEKREEVLEMMIAGLTRIYRYFEPDRRSLQQAPRHMPFRREGPKIGRNEQCPCGSGRKYKHCCGASARMVH
ncbi:MAG: uncharacterized protein QOG25_207 [Acetobacteraceae bacterium]|jgi:uncharacterized protein|nr:uncharacterized protein [Acetobacteraceae bacterium]